ncbi:hypothetical protein PsYK624_061550 [Phanerochaete sordida]|uniref:F-box domain-containing protein n=1 Tax=Phanerochaete sordida TaxID=48140 RepID=A0A9P3G9V5_9APHY|nr:hypothetical protein PsYK624_061550 [Phanerochaete sordida]
MLRLNTPAQADELLGRLESEATRIQATMLAVKSRRNALVPIGRLPPELLAEVFYELVCLYDDHPRSPKQHQSPFYWLYVTSVCSAWRRVALNAPRVWSHIHFHPKAGDQERITAFFARSRSAPLMIKQRELKKQLPSMITEAIFGALHRIRSLAIVLSPQFIKYTEEGKFTFDAPRLRDLTVHTSSIPSSKTSLPTITNASWPSLRYLNCVGGSVPVVQALTRPTLTHLVVTCTHVRTQSATISWVNLLRELPSLEKLSLSEVLAAPDVPVRVIPKPSRKITLPRLRCLTLADSRQGVSCADLLNHFVIPKETAVTFHAYGSGTREGYDFVMDALATKASAEGIVGGQPLPTLGVVFDTGWNSTLAIEVFTTEVASVPVEQDGREIPDFYDETPQHQFILVWDHASEMNAQIQAFAAAYPLTGLRALGMRSLFGNVDNETWRALARLPSIEDIAIEHCDQGAEVFFAVMMQSPAALPRLKRLTFRGIQWNMRHRSKRRRKARVDSLMVRLVEMLEGRKARGLGLQLLDIAYCTHMRVQDGVREDMRRLRAVVGDIEIGDSNEGDSAGECLTCSAASSEDEDDEEDDEKEDDEDEDDNEDEDEHEE